MNYLSESLVNRRGDVKDAIKYIVVGASGFVGQNLFRYLKDKGEQVVGTRSSSAIEGLLPFKLGKQRLCDAIGPEFLRNESKLCVIIAAVVSDMDRCLTDRESSRHVNVDGTIQLLLEVQSLGAKPIFLSSCFVFDGRKGYYSESDPCSPANEYGRNKVDVERFIDAQVPEAFVARLDKIVGDQPRERQLFGSWHEQVRRNEPITCIKGSLLSPTYVLDVAQAIHLACWKNICGLYHVSNSEFFYRDELARQFCYALGVSPNVITKPLEEFNFADNRALKSYLNGSRFRTMTGLAFTPMSEVFSRFKKRLE